ncbi:hypothetical protein Tco_0610867 [Tanacetum coccineum]
MFNMSEVIHYAGSDARPPMLDRTDFESWQQQIRLYCLGKDNGGEYNENQLLKVHFKWGTMRDTPYEGKNNVKNKEDRITEENMQRSCWELGMWRGIWGHSTGVSANRSDLKDSEYFKDKLLLIMLYERMELDAVLDEEQLLILAETNHCFMANLTSEEAGASYDSNIPSEVQDREYDSDCEDNFVWKTTVGPKYVSNKRISMLMTQWKFELARYKELVGTQEDADGSFIMEDASKGLILGFSLDKPVLCREAPRA